MPLPAGGKTTPSLKSHSVQLLQSGKTLSKPPKTGVFANLNLKKRETSKKITAKRTNYKSEQSPMSPNKIDLDKRRASLVMKLKPKHTLMGNLFSPTSQTSGTPQATGKFTAIKFPKLKVSILKNKTKKYGTVKKLKDEQNLSKHYTS